MGDPIMSSQKIGPSSLASRVRSCTGAFGSSDSMLPTTGLVGGCGIGLSLFLDGIVENVSPCVVSIRRGRPRGSPLHNRRGVGAPLVGALFEPRRLRRHPNLFLRHSISLAETSSGFSCCV